MDLVQSVKMDGYTMTKKIISVEAPVIIADWCECMKPKIKLLEKNHLCWCRCFNCGQESVGAWDNEVNAVVNWRNGNMIPKDGPSILEYHFDMGDMYEKIYESTS